jgi:nucleotide-binding universal stress UspA family protein
LEERIMKKILCATDGADHTNQAIITAAELATKFNADLTICIVNVMHGGPRGPLINSWTDAEIKKILDAAAETAKKAGAASVKELQLVSREASSGLVQYAEHNGYDHIVVGTGDKRGLSRLVLGSVAADVASRAHCSVTVVR